MSKVMEVIEGVKASYIKKNKKRRNLMLQTDQTFTHRQSTDNNFLVSPFIIPVPAITTVPFSIIFAVSVISTSVIVVASASAVIIVSRIAAVIGPWVVRTINWY